METLRRFNGDKNTKSDLLNYCKEYFKGQIIERAVSKKGGIESLADAIIELDNAFKQLETDYGVPTPKTTQTSAY